jgi:CBS domain-containing protein
MVINPITANLKTTIIELAQMMKTYSIGSIILVEDNKPFGIVTERDLVWRIIASEKDYHTLNASDVSSRPVLTIFENEEIEHAIEYMKEHKVRRLVVVNENGEVSGILTSDDIAYNIKRLAKELAFEYVILSRNIRGRT